MVFPATALRSEIPVVEHPLRLAFRVGQGPIGFPPSSVSGSTPYYTVRFLETTSCHRQNFSASTTETLLFNCLPDGETYDGLCGLCGYIGTK